MRGIYKHYKGGLYWVDGVASVSTNGLGVNEQVVRYYSLERCEWYVREIGEFKSFVTIGTGAKVPRFEFLHKNFVPVSADAVLAKLANVKVGL